jgi:dsRNA-specific ribonuclease
LSFSKILEKNYNFFKTESSTTAKLDLNHSNDPTAPVNPAAENILNDIKNFLEAQQMNRSAVDLPALLITELTESNKDNVSMPNIYHVFQSVTTRSCQDNFDLERYELIGDSYLKLVVVMTIYLQFTQTNEGNMAELKSQRVSNKYLYHLAIAKNLDQYINVQNFQPRMNWLAPNQKRPDTITEEVCNVSK